MANFWGARPGNDESFTRPAGDEGIERLDRIAQGNFSDPDEGPPGDMPPDE